MKLPERKPDFTLHDIDLWFEEMIMYSRITKNGDRYVCPLVLTLDKHLALQIPKEVNLSYMTMMLNGINPGDVCMLSDDLNDMYWKWVSERILLEESYGNY